MNYCMQSAKFMTLKLGINFAQLVILPNYRVYSFSAVALLSGETCY